MKKTALKRKTPLKSSGIRRKKKKMSELTPYQQKKRREKFALNRQLRLNDGLSRQLATLYWGTACRWPICKGGNNILNWHHFVTRRIWSVRWDPMNLIPFHDKCHKHGAHGKHSHYCVDIMLERLGQEGFEAFMRKKNTETWEETIEYLQEVEKRLRADIERKVNAL